MPRKKKVEIPGGEMVIYQAAKGAPKVQVTLRMDSLWLSLNQIGDLFQKEATTIGRQLRNIFKNQGVKEEFSCCIFCSNCLGWQDLPGGAF